MKRRLAVLFALLAILLNQALLPALHVAHRTSEIASTEALAAHAGHGSEHHGGVGDRKNPEPADHQLCHFCRLQGAALPPPPTYVLARIPASVAVAWTPSRRTTGRNGALRSAHRARAPPDPLLPS